MTDQRFPFLRLPDDLRSKVLQITDYQEIIAYSFLSKKAFSTIKALRLPISNVIIRTKKQPEIEVDLDSISIEFKLNMPKNDAKMTNLNGLPINVKVTYNNYEIPELRGIISTWTNQGKTVGEWIQHLCSISEHNDCSVALFHVREIELDIQTLRNTFPKLRTVSIKFPQADANENDILSAQNVLNAFLLYVKRFRFEHAPFQNHFSLQHVGMGNLEWLGIHSSRNLRFDDLLSLNAEYICLDTDQMSLRDLNRFFKLWKKGSNPKLENFYIYWRTETIPDWKVLLNGLKAKEAESELEGWKKFKIQHCCGICAEIKIRHSRPHANLRFTVSD